MCLIRKIKLSWSELNPEDAGLNEIKEVSGLRFAHFQEGVSCVQHVTQICLPLEPIILWDLYSVAHRMDNVTPARSSQVLGDGYIKSGL